MEAVKEKPQLQKYPAYKDSGVEWLGEIPEHWNEVKLKYIAEVKKGILPKLLASEPEDNLPPYLSMEYLRGAAAEVWVKDKDAIVVEDNELLLLWDGSNAGEFIKSRKGVISSTVAHIFFSDIDQDFAKFYCQIIERHLRNNTVGMGIPHVNSKTLNNSTVLIPPKKEQTAIANFLDEKCGKIDTAIAHKQQLIELLKERKQVIIQNAVTKGLDPDVKMKDSSVEWIGEIPEHWNIVANRSLFRESNLPGEENLPLLMVSIHTAVSSEEMGDEDNIRGRVKIEDKTKYKLVKPKDIVFNMMRAWQGAIGAVSVKGLVSPAYIVATPNKYIDSRYFEHQYRTDSFIEQMNQNSKGITDFRKRLYWDEFKQLLTVLPPIEEQEEIVEKIQELNLKIENAIALQQLQIEKLKEYKSSLIDAAVTGKIKVSLV